MLLARGNEDCSESVEGHRRELYTKNEWLYMNYWIFKCDPTKYKLDSRLADQESRTRWHISRYREKVQVGDIAFIWQTGKHRAIRATMRIDSLPEDVLELDTEQKYLETPNSSIECRVDATILRRDLDLSADKIRTIAGLEGLSALKAVPAGIFEVTSAEATILLEEFERLESTTDSLTSAEKRALHRDLAARLNKEWKIAAVQARFRETGNFYATLKKFPAALLDRYGYVLFASKEEYLTSPYLTHYTKLIRVAKGISKMPAYVPAGDAYALPGLTPEFTTASSFVEDLDLHSYEVTEGNRRLVLHIRRERNQSIVKKKKKSAKSLQCEICGFSFHATYGADAADYCEVHHCKPLSEIDESTKTRLCDLAIVCSNCHRVIHIRKAPLPPYTLDEVRQMRKQNSDVGAVGQ